MLFIERAQLCTYADLSVVCGERETFTVRKNGRSLGQAVTNPAIIVEALSEATERYDRDGKFQAYKQLASLREYILVAQDRRSIEVFRRAEEWRGEVATEGRRAASTEHGSASTRSTACPELRPRMRQRASGSLAGDDEERQRDGTGAAGAGGAAHSRCANATFVR